jgi:hypothetical protein
MTNDSVISARMIWWEATSTGAKVAHPDGILEPGESALVQIDRVGFTNQNAFVSFWPSVGTFSSGYIRGLSFGLFDINGSGGTTGFFNFSSPPANSAGTSGFGVRGAWRLSWSTTLNLGSNGLRDVEFGQFFATPLAEVTDNPVTNVFRFLWTPSSFDPRTIRFDAAPAASSEGIAAGVLVDLDPLVCDTVAVPISHLELGGVSIPIAPAPPTLLAGAAAAFLFRRPRGHRRR